MKVSIIVPVFNSEKYISDALYSLVNQTISDYEIIVIDDGSTDSSLDIINYYKSMYPSIIKVIRNKENMGQSFSRNEGILYSSGEYIGFLDSDDFVSYDMYRNMYYEALKYDKPETIVTGICFVRDNSILKDNFSCMYKSNGKLFNVLDNPEVILSMSPSVCNKLFRRDTIKDMFLRGKMWEDIGFSFSKMFNSNSILYFNNTDYFYRKSINRGVSSRNYSVNLSLLDIFDVCDSIKSEAIKTNRYIRFKDYISYVQVYSCLQRVSEVMKWDISSKDKDYLCNLMGNLIIKKYRDYRELPYNDLSFRMGELELERLVSLTSEMDTSVSDIKELIRGKLLNLKK